MKLKVRVGPKGQIVIPKSIRERMGINPNDVVLLDMDGEKAVVEAIYPHPVEVLADIAHKVGVRSSELVWGDRLYEEVLGGG